MEPPATTPKRTTNTAVAATFSVELEKTASQVPALYNVLTEKSDAAANASIRKRTRFIVELVEQPANLGKFAKLENAKCSVRVAQVFVAKVA